MDSTSIKRLKNLHPRFARVLIEVDKKYPLRVTETARDKKTQNAMHASGKSTLKYPMSKHNAEPYSLAADVIPLPLPDDWGKEWIHRVHFYEMSAIIMYEAKKQGLILRCGKDWAMSNDYSDNKFNDLVHLEIISIDGKRVRTKVKDGKLIYV